MSLRKYLTQAQLQEYQPDIDIVDESVLLKAEIDIDNAIASFYQGNFRKALPNTLFFDNCVFTGQTVTITDFINSNGYLSKAVIEIVSGANSESRFYINSQVANVLTLDVDTGLTETNTCKIYQLAKAPFVGDMHISSDTIYKTISEKIKEAVAYQYVFRLKNDFDNMFAQTTYSVSGASYSESFDTDKTLSAKDRISPQAYDLIDYLTIQTI